MTGNCKYYYVTNKKKYFKYTRSLEPFKNDNLFTYLNINFMEFKNFLKKK